MTAIHVQATPSSAVISISVLMWLSSQAMASECTGRCALAVDLTSAIVWAESCPNMKLSERALETLSEFKALKGELEMAGYAASRARDKFIAQHSDACQIVCTSVVVLRHVGSCDGIECQRSPASLLRLWPPGYRRQRHVRSNNSSSSNIHNSPLRRNLAHSK